MTTTKVVPGVLIATADPAALAHEAAVRIARGLRDGIAARGSASIALSGGNTPRDAYGLLAKDASVDWTKVDVLWVDERAVSATDDRSNFHHAKEMLLDPAHVPESRIHRMPADAVDLAAAARDYERILRATVPPDDRGIPSFDVMVLGIGDDGHTASLFPGEPTVDVVDRLVVDVPANKSENREARLTLTAPVIEAARAAIVLAVGRGKNGPLERAWAVEGSAHDTPARILRDVRGSVTWIIDRAAGGL